MKRRSVLAALAGMVSAPALPLLGAERPARGCRRRISIDRYDIGYNPAYMHVFVELNGERLNYCITADEMEGLAICHEYPLRIDGDKPALVTRRGRVRILIAPECPPDIARTWLAHLA